MKKLLLLLFVPGLINISFAQNETNIWYFGYGAGVDFNSGTPEGINGGNTFTIEGTASICDTAGSLLFYTDGITVWNKNHNVMINGNNLDGGYSSTQSALIVQQPGSDSIYFIFTTTESAGSNGLRYSIVDMSLNIGEGEVILKDEPLIGFMTEKVTAAKHSNGTDFWILSHEYNSDGYYAYLLTSAGVNPAPIISNIGSFWTDYIGYMKASPDGSKVASAIQYMNNIEIMDFDNSTGIYSNPITFPGIYEWTYGVEFSPDSKILYMDKYGGDSELYQVDLTAGSSTDIINSTTLIAFPNTDFCGALQLAPDGKIYLARYGTSWIGVINNPNSLGAGCNYIDDGVSFTGTCELGLPNCVPAYFNENVIPPLAIAASDSSVCQKFCIDFYDSSASNPTSWQWIFEGASPSASTDQNPTGICYDTPGSFDVTLITLNANGSDTLLLPDYITVYTTPPFPIITQNGNTLTASPADSYQWQLNLVDVSGATNQTYEATQSGLYTVIITDSNGCTNSATIDVVFTGMENFFPNAHLSIYPNPSNGSFTVEMMNSIAEKEITIKLLNAIGKEVYTVSERISGEKFKKEIHLTDKPYGFYLLRIEMSEFTFNQSIILN
ncbi:MAG: T9SS type A sorting domain-containing protein [Chitinophagales bacterium]|nr:T9SS type A sorting domain-containing protein [Chitinophagales bacterium]